MTMSEKEKDKEIKEKEEKLKRRGQLRIELSEIIRQSMGLRERAFDIQNEIKSIDEELRE